MHPSSQERRRLPGTFFSRSHPLLQDPELESCEKGPCNFQINRLGLHQNAALLHTRRVAHGLFVPSLGGRGGSAGLCHHFPEHLCECEGRCAVVEQTGRTLSHEGLNSSSVPRIYPQFHSCSNVLICTRDR